MTLIIVQLFINFVGGFLGVLQFPPPLRWGVLDTSLCDKVCERLAAGWLFSLGTPVSSTNKTNRNDISEILLKVAVNIL
jgi:hypothetical protein